MKILLPAQAAHHRKRGGTAHADGPPLAVQEPPVAGGSFNRVAYRMPKVQDRAQPLLPLILLDDLRLDRTGPLDEEGQWFLLTTKNLVEVRFNVSEQL